MALSTDKERFACLQLYRTKNIGAVTFKQLLHRFGSAEESIKHLPHITSRHGKTLTVTASNTIKKELKQAEKNGAKLLTFMEEDFPTQLLHAPSCPPVIFVKGHTHLLNENSIAIVGSRSALPISCRFAYRMARELGKEKSIIISGLAMGVDGSAHEGSLESGTVAVLAGGIDVPYPKQNSTLYDSVCSQGCVISEMPLGTKPNAKLFPMRNRIIAGLSVAVAVIEAELKSGSLITANFANEMGRDVFAVPGHPTDGKFRGCNKLIKDGAGLLETPEDILSNLAIFKHTQLSEKPTFDQDTPPVLSDEEAKRIAGEILSLLQTTSMDINTLIRYTNISAKNIKAVLLEMELSEILTISASGMCTLV